RNKTNVHAFARQLACDCGADTAAGAGYECDFSVQLKFHYAFPSIGKGMMRPPAHCGKSGLCLIISERTVKTSIGAARANGLYECCPGYRKEIYDRRSVGPDRPDRECSPDEERRSCRGTSRADS